jgi:hypothetical protein
MRQTPASFYLVVLAVTASMSVVSLRFSLSKVSGVENKAIFSINGGGNNEPQEAQHKANESRARLYGLAVEEAWPMVELDETDSRAPSVRPFHTARTFESLRGARGFSMPQGETLLLAPKQSPPFLAA